jgi:Ca2+-dependent lipid-binding protein
MSSHPFCALQLKSKDGKDGYKEEGKLFKTAIIHEDVNPCWNEAFIMYALLSFQVRLVERC